MNDTRPDDWSLEQGEVFSRVYRFMTQNPEMFRHPLAPLMEQEHWNTICHNAAWFCASAVENERFRLLDEDGVVIADSDAGLNS